MAKGKNAPQDKVVETYAQYDATRKNIPTAEHQSVMSKDDLTPVRVAYERRNRDLDPQLVWRGKDDQDWSDLVVHAPPLYIQEKIKPQVLIRDLMERTKAGGPKEEEQLDMFADFNGLPEGAERTDFYQHDGHWQNRMILGDSLQVMVSLAEKEGLRGKVQCIYIDPPYGIKFNSNFQWSTTSRDVKDGKVDHITREPEMVKAFRDTWRDGVHSYLTYLRDRLTVARDLLTESGSVFVQIGDENVHRVRALMDEVFGDENFVSQITMKTTGGLGSSGLKGVCDYIIWYSKSRETMRFRKLLLAKEQGEGSSTGERYSAVYEPGTGVYRTLSAPERDDPSNITEHIQTFRYDNLISSGYTPSCIFALAFEGRQFVPGGGRSWKTNLDGIVRLTKAGRLGCTGKSVQFRRFLKDYPSYEANNIWSDISIRTDKQYIVETSATAIQRCILMATDPGDLVLDPTCGSGTTAYVAEQWGRRWITIDTSRVALALARARLMGARYPYYLLADSPEGQEKEADVARKPKATTETFGNIRHGFVYERVPHITLKSIANNAEIDVIWDTWQPAIQRSLGELSNVVGIAKKRYLNHPKPNPVADLPERFEEWQVPRTIALPLSDWATKEVERIRTDLQKTSDAQLLNPTPPKIDDDNLDTTEVSIEMVVQVELARFWELRIRRQKAIDASIAAKADSEFLYDKPYTSPKKVRVAGPFTVESLSPHRSLGLDENDNLIDNAAVRSEKDSSLEREGFVNMVLENLRIHGVQQSNKEDKINFTALTPWPGRMICAEGVYREGETTRRAGVMIGPEFGTVSRPDLVETAREAGDADFDVVVACGFNFDAHSNEFSKLGRVPVLKARMNADLHMSDDLKGTGKGNLFVIFGEPEIELEHVGERVQVRIKGVDIFDPSTGEIRSDDPDGIACWFIDTNYNGESFFVRHAYFLGANDPYKALKTTLKAEINEEAWESLHSEVSRPFEKPETGRIAVKVINHLGDEVMKVYRV